MKETNFIKQRLSKYISGSQYQKIDFDKPTTCPLCGIGTDGVLLRPVIESFTPDCQDNTIVFIWRCTACRRVFASYHLLRDQQCTYHGTFPQQTLSFEDEVLENVSPRFIEMYNQCLRSDINGDYNLAAVGMRSALEILVKDYAIFFLEKQHDDVVNLNLFSAISEFLENSELIKAADVIRILGNDHTHYERKYPQHEYKLLKMYMDIFIELIRNKVLIKNPPVSREK